VIVVVMGVTGCGKSTVGAELARERGWPFIDGDDLHPASNVAKMAAGVPLTDEDRWPWLTAIRARMDAWSGSGGSGVVACSALRRVYRDVLRGGGVRFVFLDVDPGVLAARLGARRGHFMKAGMLESQLATLERPGADEGVLTVPVAAGSSTSEVLSVVEAGLPVRG
jgi:gluconokinase